MTTSREWLSRAEYDQFSEARGQADGAKLLATFAAAVAATMVGTELQVRNAHTSPWDTVAMVGLGTSFALAIAVVFLDRTRGPDTEVIRQIMDRAENEPSAWISIQTETLSAHKFNRWVLALVRRTVVFQLGISFMTASLGAILAAFGPA